MSLWDPVGPRKYVNVEHFWTSPELFTIVTGQNFFQVGPWNVGIRWSVTFASVHDFHDAETPIHPGFFFPSFPPLLFSLNAQIHLQVFPVSPLVARFRPRLSWAVQSLLCGLGILLFEFGKKKPCNARGRRLVELTDGCYSGGNSQGLPGWIK